MYIWIILALACVAALVLAFHTTNNSRRRYIKSRMGRSPESLYFDLINQEIPPVIARGLVNSLMKFLPAVPRVDDKLVHDAGFEPDDAERFAMEIARVAPEYLELVLSLFAERKDIGILELAKFLKRDDIKKNRT